jgi:hypothetical protein
MTESRKAYIVKNAFRDGIRCVELVVETTNFVRVKWPSGHEGERHFDKADVRNTLEEAQAAVRAMAESGSSRSTKSGSGWRRSCARVRR